MKQADRRAFSAESGEYGDDAMGLTLGMLDNKEGGAMRNTVEKRKMRQANTKASRKRAVLMSLGATNGLASSMVFTPVQGLELVNPDANGERVRHRRIPSGFPRMLDFNLLFQKVVTQSFFICFFSLFYLSATLSLGALKISPLVVAASAWHLTSTSQ
mmetsp:Transcript_38603/g.70798  ORF Transcript_38603/g.70798 Transcript_38603/m.70798 type:complete len:158 (+) Transcript_38603:1220-1693(+)